MPSTGPEASTYIHGSVTFTSVTAGESWGASDITSFVLAAGPSDYYTVSSANGDIIEQAAFYFDAQGNMTSWFFVVWSRTGYQNFPQFSIDGTTGPPPDEGDQLTIGTGAGAWATFTSSTESGIWTANVPAPCSILLLGSSLLGLAVARLRKR